MQWTPRPIRGVARGHVLLVGMPGAGKSVLGKALALRLQRRLVDLDAAIAADAGQPVGQLLRQEGEEAFRIREAAVLREQLADVGPLVLATGGGAPCFFGGMAELLQAGTVLWLDAPAEVLTERVLADETERSLLGATRQLVAERLTELRAQREATYAQADFRLDATKGPRDVLQQALRALGPVEVLPAVAEDGRTTPVYLHDGDVCHAAAALAEQAGTGNRIALLIDAQVQAQAEPLERILRDRGCAPTRLVLPGGERCKDIKVLAKVWQWLATEGIGRDDLLVGVGGGAMTDLAGFAAATWLRGIRVAQLPTTLLAMADASVGGKTAIDLELPGGHKAKNLVGAFHAPELVWLPLQSLHTLPLRHWRAGLAEVAKMLLLFDPAGWQLLGQQAKLLRQRDVAALLPLLRSAVAHKAAIVAADPREHIRQGAMPQRAMLNLGHTLAHALEADSSQNGYTLLHGEAVALGLCAAAQWSEHAGYAPAGLAAEVSATLAALDLPVDWAARTSTAVLDLAATDKKRRGDALYEVALGGVGRAEVVRVRLTDWRDALAGLAAAAAATAATADAGWPAATGTGGPTPAGVTRWRTGVRKQGGGL